MSLGGKGENSDEYEPVDLLVGQKYATRLFRLGASCEMQCDVAKSIGLAHDISSGQVHTVQYILSLPRRSLPRSLMDAVSW